MADGRLHCSVHVVRLTVDHSSFEYLLPRTTLQTRSAKTRSRRSIFGSRWRPRDPGCAVRQSKPVLCEQHGQFSSQKKTEGSFQCSLNSSLRIDLDLRVTRWRERAPERKQVTYNSFEKEHKFHRSLHILAEQRSAESLNKFWPIT